MSDLEDPERVRAAATRFVHFFNELGRAYLEREDVLAQVALALLCREHVLLMGPPGTAKSQIASAVLGRIVDEKTRAPSLYSRQFTESTVQTDLVGPLNFKTLMETGRTEHFTDEGMLGAVHAFLDEVFDGRDMLLRSALNVLNEREIKQGTRTTRGQIECAIMTSNRYLAEILEGSRETLLAFIDRIAFVGFVPRGFAHPANLAQVLKRQYAGATPPALTEDITIQDIDALQAMTERVRVSPEVCDGLVAMLMAFDEEIATALKADPEFVATRYLSTRTVVRCGRVLRAIVAYDKLFRMTDRPLEVVQGDFYGLRLHLLLAGPTMEAVAKLSSRETDPRERRQLNIARTEREIFDRVLQKMSPIAPPKERPVISIAPLESQWAEALSVGTPAGFSSALRALSEAAARDAEGREAAQMLLQVAVDDLVARGVREGMLANVPRGGAPDDAVPGLLDMADVIDKAPGNHRAVARWVRARALGVVDEVATLAPSKLGTSIDAVVSRGAFVEAAKVADGHTARIEKLFALRKRLFADGVDAVEAELSDAAWTRALARVEADVVPLWDAAFNAAVQEALRAAGGENLSGVLRALEPAFARIGRAGERLVAMGLRDSKLKSRVVGPRIGPLVKTVFGRLDARNRDVIVGDIGRTLALLKDAGVEKDIEPRELLWWAVGALVRSAASWEAPVVQPLCDGSRRPPPLPAPSLEAPVVQPLCDRDGYRALRQAEQRAPLVFVALEIAAKVAPSLVSFASPKESVGRLRALLAGLPAEVQGPMVNLDLERVSRVVSYLERWWALLVEPAHEARLESVTPAQAREVLAAVTASGFLAVVRDESALARFGLEANMTAEVFPEYETRARAVHDRAVALAERSQSVVNALLGLCNDEAWKNMPPAAKASP